MMDEKDLFAYVKERLIQSLHLAEIDRIPINKIIFAYVNLKRLELELDNANSDERDTIIIKYVEELARNQ